ncbi:FHA modulated ABC efflux pump ATPase/integral membrane protein [Nitzschia inconspicua]|uniref:FHA modulated ABC efflux pump ATPase/integral membrane protein n=1 Tax=Nitzschia inconspicua TaxID=303405 RepID=A0A9K3KBC5_9STRA|nr:FHA modulated ABC efflux pump ATPase/integral membrane protein [Nitzschia inconspicua]
MRHSRNSCGRSIFRRLVVCIALWFSLAELLSLTLCSAQRVVPLGSRLKKRFGGGRSDSGSYVVQQEEIVVQDDHVMAMSGLESVELGFSDLHLELSTKKNKKNGQNVGTRILLDGSIRGLARPGRMLAIMGPSGSGKSTTLHALAGRIKESSKLKLSGLRYINGSPITGDSQVPAAFVEQEVSFFPHMTVRETLAFRVELKLGSLISKKAQAQRVQELIEEMNLDKVADTVVGDAKVRGISGGERRRLAIACELVSSPSLVFLDEPTSGLDSTAATQVVQALKKLSESGKTVIAVIHQPSQHVFASFDDLLLISEGKQMYYGEVWQVRNYMDTHVTKAPDGMGTAEHILDCISKLPLPGESPDDTHARIERLAFLAREQQFSIGAERSDSKAMKRYGGDAHVRRANIFVQFKLLLRRSLRENFRSKATLIIKTVQQVSLGLIYGTIYTLGMNQASIQDRFGLLSLIAIGASNMAMASTVRSFPKEKAIVSNELAGKMYGTLPYFIGKAVSEIPLTFFFNSLFGILVSALTGLNGTMEKLKRFLGLNSLHGLTGQSAGLMIGAVAPNQDSALALFPAIMVLNIIFDGKNISEENTPRFLRWLPKVGLIRWGFEGFCLNEFAGLVFDTSGPRRGPVAKNGADALARFGLGENSLGTVVKAQVFIVSACWLLSYLGLTLTRQKFQQMEPPPTRIPDQLNVGENE